MTRVFFISLCVLFSPWLFAQVGIGTTSPNGSALLDLSSSSKGFLPPRMTSSQRLAIQSPANGLLVFDTTTDTYWFFDGTRWNELTNANTIMDMIPSNRINPNGVAGDNFGFSVALGGNGNEGLVGSPMLDNGGSGACYRIVYTENNLWTLSPQNPAGIAAGDGYGYAVAFDRHNGANDAVVSAPFDDSSTVMDMGAVYFFDGNVFKNKMYAPLAGRVAGAKFGRSVDIAGNTTQDKVFAIVGAPGANSNRGAAYIYQYNPNTDVWDFEATLTDNLGAAADSFGLSVSLYYNVAGDTAWAFVGAPYDDENAVNNIGSVTVFRKAAGSATWTRVSKFTVPGETVGMNFGYSIGNVMRCGQVLIGAPLYATGIGRLYNASLSALSGGVAEFTLTELPPVSGSAGVGQPGLGFNVSAMGSNYLNCTGDIFVLSGSFSGIVSSNSSSAFGVAFLYKRSAATGAWSFIEKITDTEVETTGYGFGRAACLHTSNKIILIGAPLQRVEGMLERGKIQFRRFGF